MADQKQVKILKESLAKWNAWRGSVTIRPDLNGADLSSINLIAANLSSAYLGGASLMAANLSSANLSGADLSSASLIGANLMMANLNGADMTGALLLGTVFGNVDLTSVIGLETCIHHGPSIIDHRTLERSKSLPLPFLRGVGVPDSLIEYLPSLLNPAVQRYSCFISYSTKDQEFAERLMPITLTAAGAGKLPNGELNACSIAIVSPPSRSRETAGTRNYQRPSLARRGASCGGSSPPVVAPRREQARVGRSST